MASGRVVVVTGASGGLGQQLVETFLAAGDTVVAHTRTSESVTDRLRATGSLLVHGDLRTDAGAGMLVDTVVGEHGRIDVLVNNAADQSLGEDLSSQQWEDMLQATLLSAVRVATAARPHLGNGSAIVNVSSVEASVAFAHHAHYAAAKAALESYTRSLALQLGPHGIRANAVAPGLIERENLAREWPEGHRSWSSSSPLGRPVTAQEVADAVLFLAGASGVTGIVLAVDGGWSSNSRMPS